MSVTEQIDYLLEQLPESEKYLLLKIIKRFVPDDVATPEDLATHEAAIAAFNRGECVLAEAPEPGDVEAHETAMREYARGETIPDSSINWD
jgi:hypothetical protein